MDNLFPLLLLLAAGLSASWLWRSRARKQPSAPPCPKCGAQSDVERIGSETEKVEFYERMGGGHAANVEPVYVLRVRYACTHCRHQWTVQERQHT